MSYSIPMAVKIFPASSCSLRDFLQTLSLRQDTMVLFSENCYNWLKSNSTCIKQTARKVFSQQDSKDNNTTYIETINIDSSNCSFLKSINCDNYTYEYTNGIPKKVIIIILDKEQNDFNNNISISVIESNQAESPVECIIDNPSIFEDSIIFLNSKSYKRLKLNTSRTSCISNIERLSWCPDNDYPGGNIVLHCLNYGNLYCINNMDFPFFSKNFGFNQTPKSIFFISEEKTKTHFNRSVFLFLVLKPYLLN